MKSKVKLTELIVDAGIIDESDIAKSCELAEHLQCQPGVLLVEKHVPNEKVLALAVHLMALVNEGQIGRDHAVRILQLCRIQVEYGIDEAFAWAETLAVLKQAQLGQLLSRAGLIAVRALAAALLTCELLTLRLGQCLVLSGSITPNVVFAALELQDKVNLKILSFDQAIDLLAVHMSADEYRRTFLQGLPIAFEA